MASELALDGDLAPHLAASTGTLGLRLKAVIFIVKMVAKVENQKIQAKALGKLMLLNDTFLETFLTDPVMQQVIV